MVLESEEFYSYVLKPKKDPFGLIIYSAKTNTISIENLQKNTIKSYNLDRFSNEASAYCNSNEVLYISGGIKPNKGPISDFWIINYNYNLNTKKYNFQIEATKMPYEKKQHSMLYDKKDESIYIIGGNDKKCFKYSIKEKKFHDLAETNALYTKPALIIKSGFLYIFDSFDNKKPFFEKLDLNKKKAFWEKFYPKNYDKYNNHFYGISNLDMDDKFIFVGGEVLGNNRTVIYEIKNNKLENGDKFNTYAKLNDKSFYKINKNYYVNIVDYKGKSFIILTIDNIKQEVNKIYFDENGKTTSNFDSMDETDISIEPDFDDNNKKLVKNNKIILKSNSIQFNDFEKDKKVILKSTNINTKLNLSENENLNNLKKLDTVEIKNEQEIKDKKSENEIYILKSTHKNEKNGKAQQSKKKLIYVNLNNIITDYENKPKTERENRK